MPVRTGIIFSLPAMARHFRIAIHAARLTGSHGELVEAILAKRSNVRIFDLIRGFPGVSNRSHRQITPAAAMTAGIWFRRGTGSARRKRSVRHF